MSRPESPSRSAGSRRDRRLLRRARGVAGIALVAACAFAWAAADSAGIDWRPASSDADVDLAFQAAQRENKPVFLYWGATWCPPCNQVKATLFNRQDFIERSRAFVAVYIDGDSPGAQKLGTRFHVSGYPTMVLFAPRGAEITRLPGEVDPARYSQVLALGMNATRPAKAVLADALAGGKGVVANEWRLLAFYSWDLDEQQLVAKDELGATLERLAAACPPGEREAATRLELKALAARDAKAPPRLEKAAWLRAVLGDAARVREQTDTLGNDAAELVRATTPAATAARREVVAAYDRALQKLEADPTLSRADRMQALIARVDLARIDMPDDSTAAPSSSASRGARPAVKPALAPTLLADVRAQSARADREITDGYERQAVITSAAYVLDRAGLDRESDALLEGNLAKSHSPYYLMSQLAGNARRRGDSAAALRWYGEAYAKSEGPATRLQWGSSYLAALVDLSPADETAIERTTTQIWNEAAMQPDAFYERSGRSLKRVGARLVKWNEGNAHAAAFARLQGRLDSLCAGRPAAERPTCSALLAPTAAKSAT